MKYKEKFIVMEKENNYVMELLSGAIHYCVDLEDENKQLKRQIKKLEKDGKKTYQMVEK